MGYMQVNGQKSSFLTIEARGGNNGQTINDARTNSKNELASVLKGNSRERTNNIKALFDASENDVSVEQLQKLANVVEVLTVIGRDHAGCSAKKYNSHREEMPTKSEIKYYMKSIGIVQDKIPHIINICLHTGRSEKYSLFHSSNFRTNSANSLHKTIMAKIAIMGNNQNIGINHLDIKKYLDGSGKFTDGNNGKQQQVIALLEEIREPEQKYFRAVLSPIETFSDIGHDDNPIYGPIKN